MQKKLVHFVPSEIDCFMKQGEFKKLRVKWPVQPMVNQRPWAIAGWLLVIIILLIAAWGYYSSHQKGAGLTAPVKQSILK